MPTHQAGRPGILTPRLDPDRGNSRPVAGNIRLVAGGTGLLAAGSSHPVAGGRRALAAADIPCSDRGRSLQDTGSGPRRAVGGMPLVAVEDRLGCRKGEVRRICSTLWEWVGRWYFGAAVSK